MSWFRRLKAQTITADWFRVMWLARYLAVSSVGMWIWSLAVIWYAS